MKRYIQTISLVIGVVLLIAVFLPNIMLNSTAFAKGDTKGSTIGGVEVIDVKDPAFESALQAAITEWQGTAIEVSGGESAITIDSNNLTFDLASAISQYEAMTEKPWYAIWQKDRIVQIPIPVTVNESAIAQIQAVATWDSEKTLNNVIAQASYLRKHEVEAVVDDAFMQTEERIGFQVADIPAEVLGMPEVISSLNEIILAPNKPVSLLALLGAQAEVVNEVGLDFLASMLYSTVLQTNYEMIERHSQQVLPAYLQQGIEADVNVALEKDLQFVNRSDQPGKLRTTIEGNTLKIEIFAPTKVNEITVHVRKDKIVKPRVIYRYSDELNSGQERVEQEGQEGVRVEVYRWIVENGTTTEQLVSRDYYAPQNRIVTRSSKAPIVESNPTQDSSPNTADPDLQIDLNGDDLPDTENTKPNSNSEAAGPDIVYGYYDKGGNFVQTSP